MRAWYFKAPIDLGSSGATPIQLGRLRERLDIPPALLDECSLDDSDTLGAPGLRRAIATHYGNDDPARVLVGSGSNEVLFFLLSALFGPGDDVLVLDPIYHSLRNVAAAQGASLRPFELHPGRSFEVDIDALCDAIGPQTHAVIVNFPHMPTGRSIGKSAQDALIERCRSVGALLIWDGALMDMMHRGDPIANPTLRYERAILTGTLSKSFGLPGLRVGWAIGAPELLQRVEVWKDHTSLYVSPLLERIAEVVVDRAPLLLDWRKKQVRDNLATLGAWLETMSDDVQTVMPDGGFTIFPRLPQIHDVDDFCRRLASEHGVMLVPGSCFGQPQHVRLGVGAPPDDLAEGLSRLGDALLQSRGRRAPRSTATRRDVSRFSLSRDDKSLVDDLLARITAKVSSASDPTFLEAAPLLAHELPQGLKQAIHRFRLREEGPGVLLLDGFAIDDEALAATPSHWDVPANDEARRMECLGVVCSALLGEPFAWDTQQKGHLVHNVLPMAAHIDDQLGFSSEEPLWWHTEDAFHPLRPDYLALLCLRNPDGVPTTLSSAADLRLDPDTVDALFEPHFTIRPDKSHLAASSEDEPSTAARQRMEALDSAPPPIEVFFGDRNDPYMRLDPFFMGPPTTPSAARALEALKTALDASLFELVLQPGQIAVLDNYRVVHGRRPFKARVDGRERWLKRIDITRDLRKSRHLRPTARSRSLQ
ncbi:MAG: aminotransferase class I/II-fold pyridoxal phosphate-dependent enzyme [Deltaproteobacteria bacterium]|nr:aminotransferase class I/II-fold pyridoxal phosphate-dependent enzyme [Deltaproteobacteria bacterium]